MKSIKTAGKVETVQSARKWSGCKSLRGLTQSQQQDKQNRKECFETAIRAGRGKAG